VTHRRAEELNRRFYLFAESDLNDARVISPETVGGFGLDAQWSDDFHHCLHVLLTGEKGGYYADFDGVGLLAKVFRHGFAFTGQYARSRKRRHGNRPRFNSSRQFVVCSQNHDQIGNRREGDRLSTLTSFEALKLAAGTVLLSPFIPLLFMGEEYGESAPFQYVVSHTTPELVEAVRLGRSKEFSGFSWQGEVPDPGAEATFQRCILNRQLCKAEDSHQKLYSFYRELIQLRLQTRAIMQADLDSLEARGFEAEAVVHVLYKAATEPVCIVLCFSSQPVSLAIDLPAGAWKKLLDSAAVNWSGPGSSVPDRIKSTGRIELKLNPISLVVFQQAG